MYFHLGHNAVFSPFRLPVLLQQIWFDQGITRSARNTCVFGISPSPPVLPSRYCQWNGGDNHIYIMTSISPSSAPLLHWTRLNSAWLSNHLKLGPHHKRQPKILSITRQAEITIAPTAHLWRICYSWATGHIVDRTSSHSYKAWTVDLSWFQMLSCTIQLWLRHIHSYPPVWSEKDWRFRTAILL